MQRVRRINAAEYRLVVGEERNDGLLVGGTDGLWSATVDSGNPSRRITVDIAGGEGTPLGKGGPVPRGHVADVLGHLQGEVEVRGHLGNVLLQLREMLLELLVTKDRVLIVGWVVHDAASELCLGSGGDKKKRNQNESCGELLRDALHRDFLLN